MVGTVLEIYYGRLPENHIKLMLNDFTNREIIQLAKLSQKEEKMSFD